MSETTAATETAARSDGGRGGGRARLRGVLAWAGALAWGLWSLVWFAGGDRVPGVGVVAAPLLALTPYVAAASLLPVVFALLLRRRYAALVAGLVAVSLAFAVLPRAFGGAQPTAKGPVVRVLSVNLFFGEANPGRVMDLIRRTRADVVSLLELPPDAVRFYEQAGLSRLLPHKVLDARGGAAGSALYSRHPLISPSSRFASNMAMPRATLALPGGARVEVMAVHPAPPISPTAYREWKRDLAALPPARTDGTVRILAGDFNATLDHAVLRRVLARGYADAADRTGRGLIATWGLSPPRRPPLTIDHLLVDRRCAIGAVKIHDVHGTDHRAVSAEIRLP